MSGFAFYALGAPAPQGSKRHVGGGVMIESSKKVKPWRNAVMEAAPTIERPLDGPLAVKMVFTVQQPKSARKTQTRPATSPDCSKLLRAVEDAITDAKLWADDGRVCEYVRLAKVWTGHDPDALPAPGVIVACCEIDRIDADGLDQWAGPLEWLHAPFDQARKAAWGRVRGVA